MKNFCNALIASAAALMLGGCFLDSIQPWLDDDSIMPAELDFEGDWEMADDEFKDKYKVRLKKDRSTRSRDKQDYYIQVLPQTFDSSFNFSGIVHEINGIKLLQIENFSHFGDDVFSLANRPTVSLWQIAYDEDNIVIWPPALVTDTTTTLKSMQDSDDKRLFIDSTANLKTFFYNWSKNYPASKDEIRVIMPLAMTRAGTEFRMPAEMQELVPLIYEKYLGSMPKEP